MGGEIADEIVVRIRSGGLNAVDLGVTGGGEDKEAGGDVFALADGAALALDGLLDFRL